MRNGKPVYLRGNKRQRPEDNKCEVCGLVRKRLEYHHWDDDNLSKGLYLCFGCHIFAERVDKNLVKQYLKLRRQRNEEAI